MARAAAPSPRPPSAVAASSPMKPPPARFPQQRRATLVRSLPLPRPPKGGGGVGLAAAPPRRRAPSSCACSPTTHPGSFRCALHRGHPHAVAPQSQPPVSSGLTSVPRRASMANPLVRVAAAEGGGDNIRRALASPARPPQHRRRAHAFRPRPSRLSVVSSAASSDEPPRCSEEK